MKINVLLKCFVFGIFVSCATAQFWDDWHENRRSMSRPFSGHRSTGNRWNSWDSDDDDDNDDRFDRRTRRVTNNRWSGFDNDDSDSLDEDDFRFGGRRSHNGWRRDDSDSDDDDDRHFMFGGRRGSSTRVSNNRWRRNNFNDDDSSSDEDDGMFGRARSFGRNVFGQVQNRNSFGRSLRNSNRVDDRFDDRNDDNNSRMLQLLAAQRMGGNRRVANTFVANRHNGHGSLHVPRQTTFVSRRPVVAPVTRPVVRNTWNSPSTARGFGPGLTFLGNFRG